jgi:Raf kinase inhibitor-like YbhB/YbcL family protein
MRRRRLLATIGVASASLAGCAGSSGRGTPAFEASGPAFDTGEPLPARFTCDGAGVSPPLLFERVPDETAALAIVGQFEFGALNDPVFWTVWNLPPDTERVPADLPATETLPSLGDARQGQRNGVVGYSPPCPPRGQQYEHWFQLYALSERLSVPPGASHGDAVDAIEPAALASARLEVGYRRTDS